MKKIVLLIIACCCLISVHAAYLKNVPKTLTQPDGSVLHCYASGDEYFNYLHDENGFTIMQHPQTGFYVYADKQDGKLVATEFVAGKVDPASKNIKPFNLISPQEWMARRKAWEAPVERPKNRDNNPNHGTLNNISIFIRFSDDTQFTNSYSSIDNMFNDVSENAISLRSYFRAASYGAIEIPTTFYPGHNGETIISYQDTYPRSYFQPYNASTNTNGYQNDSQRTSREFSLLERAVNYVNSNYPVPTNLNIDYDNDGYVDNVCFIVRGDVGEWSSLLWPHMWSLYDRTVLINGKRVGTFNFQLADATGYFNTSTMCHEMNHSLGAPDLYHYSYSGPDAVGIWDLMHNNATPPQHCGAYMKMKYGHWIDEIPEITQAGTYTLNPISSSTPTNVAYKIQSSDPNQYYVLEYRKSNSLFETALPGSGILIYRIDTRFSGNADYDPSNGIYDEVYIFRPGGSTSVNGNLSSAYFSSNVGRTEFSASTSAYPFFTDGTIDNDFRIYNITNAGNTISFTYGSSSNCEAPTNLVASIENNNVTLSWDAVNNAQSYNIYRNESLISNTSGTTYTDSNLAYGVYSYYLKSVDANGVLSTASETVTATIMPEGTIVIGDGGSNANDFLPSYSYYNYSLTQQIYTADEIGGAGTITGMAFFNSGDQKTRTFDFYLKSTTKNSFSGTTDWETVTEADKVFSGSVTMAADEWTMIVFNTPYDYDGTSNLVLVADDNSGAWTNSPHMSCRVFNATNQAIYVYSDNTNFSPLSPPTSYTSNDYYALLSVKNQLLVTKEEVPSITTFNITVSANPAEGGSVSMEGRELLYDFEDGTSQGWTILKGTNGDSPHNWMHVTDYAFHDYTSGYGHNSSDGFMLSESYIYGLDMSVTPDNYLVSPQVRLGGSITFWATDGDDEYGEEHFAVAVSTNGNTDVSDFTQVQEWTLLTGAVRTGNTRNVMDGTWYEYTADLSAFSGMGYVAIHHFNCYDMWLLCVDDITIMEGTTGSAISGVFNSGESCSLSATPAEGYSFISWTQNGELVSTEASYSFTVTENRDLVANFAMNLSITVSVNPAEAGTVSGAGEYVYGQTCTLTAVPAEGYYFRNWTQNGDVLSTVVTYSFVVETDMDLVANFSEGLMIGDGGDATNVNLPSHNGYKYTLTEQIYTAEELGSAGLITSIAFYNDGAEKTRTCDFYMKSTEKTSFSNNTDWETVAAANMVFSGEVTMLADDWTTITLDTPYYYDGVSNIVLVVDDNSGTYTSSPHMACRVFNAESQAIYVHSNNTNYDPSNTSSYGGTLLSVKNQMLVAKEMPSTDPIIITVSADPAEGGSVTGGGEFNFGETCMVTATVNAGYYFIGWFENGELVATEREYSFIAINDRDLVATFGEGILLGDSGTSTDELLPSYSFYNYSLTQQIYTADEIGMEGIIHSIAFYNGGEERTRNYDMYLVLTDKTAFDNITDWITVTEADKVFSGSVDMIADDWTVFTLDTPFEYDGVSNLALIMDDNTGTYSIGMACRVYEAQGNQTIQVYDDNPNYNPMNPASYEGTLMNVKNQILLDIAPFTMEQNIALSTGWNWFSTNLDITLDDLKAALVEASQGTTIIIKAQNGANTKYINGNWRGQLTTLDVMLMYRIFVDNDCEITLEGMSINPAERPVTIISGANWIGFPLMESMTLDDAFAGFSVSGDQIKSQTTAANYNGTTWRPNFSLVPGQGYIYKSNAQESRTFTFPANAK